MFNIPDLLFNFPGFSVHLPPDWAFKILRITHYASTSATLTFAVGETSKTVSVAIVDDSVEDDGETFTLTLSNASGATIADASATGTIRNTEETPGDPALTASFSGMPTEHDGQSAFSFRVEFSEDIETSYQTLRDESFSVTDGDVTGARRVDGRHDLWEITVEPESREVVTISLPGGSACGTAGAVCTLGNDPRPLSNSPSATVTGPPSDPLTASFGGICRPSTRARGRSRSDSRSAKRWS